MSILPLFLKAISVGRLTVLFFQYFKDVVPLSSHLHSLQWEVCCHYLCFTVYYASIFYGYFKDFSLYHMFGET